MNKTRRVKRGKKGGAFWLHPLVIDENNVRTGENSLSDGGWETGSGLLIQSAHTHLDTQGHFSIYLLLLSDVSYSKYCFYLFPFYFEN
jgi:hypothetical protein